MSGRKPKAGKKKGSKWNREARARGSKRDPTLTGVDPERAIADSKRPSGARPVRSRIVGEGEEDPKRLVANPSNWRTHDREQREAMREVLQRVGWVQRVIVNRRTGRLLDGHMRVEEAVAIGERTVPVVYVDVSEAEERVILATLDPIGGLAEFDGERLKEVLAGIAPESKGLRKVIDGLASLTMKDVVDEDRGGEGGGEGGGGESLAAVLRDMRKAGLGSWADRVEEAVDR